MKSGSRRLAAILVALAFVALAAALPAQAKDQTGKRVPKSKIPKAVTTQYVHTYGKARIESCYAVEKDGKTLYQITSARKGGDLVLLYAAEGALQEMREPIASKELPMAVIGSVVTRFPKCKILRCERITRGRTVLYAVSVKQDRENYREVYDPQGLVQQKG